MAWSVLLWAYVGTITAIAS